MGGQGSRAYGHGAPVGLASYAREAEPERNSGSLTQEGTSGTATQALCPQPVEGHLRPLRGIFPPVVDDPQQPSELHLELGSIDVRTSKYIYIYKPQCIFHLHF